MCAQSAVYLPASASNQPICLAFPVVVPNSPHSGTRMLLDSLSISVTKGLSFMPTLLTYILYTPMTLSGLCGGRPGFDDVIPGYWPSSTLSSIPWAPSASQKSKDGSLKSLCSCARKGARKLLSAAYDATNSSSVPNSFGNPEGNFHCLNMVLVRSSSRNSTKRTPTLSYLSLAVCFIPLPVDECSSRLKFA